MKLAECTAQLTISSRRRSKLRRVRRGIQSLPSTTLVAKSCTASAKEGPARPPGGSKAHTCVPEEAVSIGGKTLDEG